MQRLWLPSTHWYVVVSLGDWGKCISFYSLYFREKVLQDKKKSAKQSKMTKLTINFKKIDKKPKKALIQNSFNMLKWDTFVWIHKKHLQTLECHIFHSVLPIFVVKLIELRETRAATHSQVFSIFQPQAGCVRLCRHRNQKCALTKMRLHPYILSIIWKANKSY